ncbi:MAG: UDP-N-acetylglucosamine 2-epimerase (non-hydrolyzing) [Paludibacter sp.]|nr:UDP-N-acetylglucosamine 2-epimerase (non-hydrolyzing) [Paludibacter sp.]
MKKVMLVFGTRPEAIKMAPLIKEFQKHTESFETIVCVSGQHREMLDQVLNLFEITTDYDLNIMKKGQDLYDVTSSVLTGMRDVLQDSKPDLVLVHGDTSTSTAAALAAFYKQIPVGHVEAGLRTFNKYSPWPEEINRQITGRIATYHFAPTQLSQQNLLNEGVSENNIFITGNTVIDALYLVIDKIKTSETLRNELNKTLLKSGIPERIINSFQKQQNSKDSTNCMKGDSECRKFILITGHRRENFGEGFISICKAIKSLAEKYPDVDFVYPMHLNPNVRKPIHDIFGQVGLTQHNQTDLLQNIFFIEPLDYLPFVYLMEKSTVVLTDSGGIQEEAPGLGKPVLVMRNTTERPEALEAGTVKLVGTDYYLIVSEVSELLDNQQYYNQMAQANNPYGDGKACERILACLI